MIYQSLLKTLQERGKLSASELKKVERVQKTSVAESLPQLLVKLGLCSELDVADAFVDSGQFEKISSDQYPIERQLPEDVSLRFLKNYHIIGLSATEDQAIVAMMDPEDAFTINALSLMIGKSIVVKVGLLSEIDAGRDIIIGNRTGLGVAEGDSAGAVSGESFCITGMRAFIHAVCAD